MNIDEIVAARIAEAREKKLAEKVHVIARERGALCVITERESGIDETVGTRHVYTELPNIIVGSEHYGEWTPDEYVALVIEEATQKTLFKERVKNDKREVFAYIPGAWVDHLEEAYAAVIEKKMAQEQEEARKKEQARIDDLKTRFGIA